MRAPAAYWSARAMVESALRVHTVPSCSSHPGAQPVKDPRPGASQAVARPGHPLRQARPDRPRRHHCGRHPRLAAMTAGDVALPRLRSTSDHPVPIAARRADPIGSRPPAAASSLAGTVVTDELALDLNAARRPSSGSPLSPGAADLAARLASRQYVVPKPAVSLGRSAPPRKACATT